ncbi:MAG: YhjD/YihY/BrkB family envelope integrity protein [Actinomycetota bacterium]
MRSGVFDATVRAWEHDTEVGGGIVGAAVAFRLFLFMVPFSFFTATALGAGARLADQTTADVAHRAGIGGVIAKGATSAESLGTRSQVIVLLVAGYATLSTARTAVGTLVRAHCLVWRVPPVRVARTRAALLFTVFVATLMLVSSYVARLRSAVPAPGVALTVTWLFVPLVCWWWASTRLPHADAAVWALLPGAVVLAIGMQVMHLFTVLYVTRAVESKSETYGALGSALAVLGWCYVAGRLITGTAVVNAALWRRFRQRHPDAAAGGNDAAGPVRSVALGWLRSAAGLFR